MKIASVSQSKKNISPSHILPREGTKLRAAHDLFRANKGLPIDWCTSRDDRGHCLLRQLQDFYGLDIRRVAKNRWMLAGEWYGVTYVDYVADRFHAADRQMVSA